MPPAAKISKKSVLSEIEVTLPPDSPPVLLHTVITSAITKKYGVLNTDAAEKSEAIIEAIRHSIRNKFEESQNDYFGYFYHLRISELNEEYIYGACHAFPGDSPEQIAAKSKRANHVKISQYIDKLNPDEFEAFCGRLISLIGVENPIVTTHGNDQGIDFFGRWNLNSAIKVSNFPDGVEKQFKAWIIGQAKKYDATKIGTNVIRELVGSVQLAKAKVFSTEVDNYTSLGVSFCDPIFYCLIITGAVTSGVARLLRNAGIIFFDKDLISVFLADLSEGKFDPDVEQSFRNWALGNA